MMGATTVQKSMTEELETGTSLKKDERTFVSSDSTFLNMPHGDRHDNMSVMADSVVLSFS